ncbi:MAG: ASKHA domain-containing protein [Methanomassiliicoccaceae archaeon]|jgi:uncharacterized 2Fe-2S/4Fe-4S cluster protein (DUF4445 family)|nr:ASKHA domain-containing protein [Methanomassiliicoccaceae archaeon]
MAKFKVSFHPDGAHADVIQGTLISDAAKAAGVTIKLPCNGNGRCGRCNLLISRPEGQKGSERVLACQTHIVHDIIVSVPSDGGEIIASNDHKRMSIPDITPMVRSPRNNYGLAVDIGTTTIAVSLIDMNSGAEMHAAAGYNRQGIRGDDVLSRIEYAGDGGTHELRELVTGTINDLIRSFRTPTDQIKAVYISGNTTMTHLFLGVDPSPIREPPYEPVIKEKEITGSESNLRVSKDARVVCMPSPAAYVGGDVTSDIINSEMDVDDELSLLIDIGTNGEVALGNKDVMLVCSSSAGPSFEGGKMTSGMMARPGAIDSFRIDDGGSFRFTVISGDTAKGICGSGLIDILAQLFLNGYIDKKGRFTGKADTKMHTADGKRLLTITKDVFISEDDIRNAIMTKAAIYSASASLMKVLGVSISDVRKVYIAGGFGNFINTENAIVLGMLPDVQRGRFVYLGNASLAGAKQALLSLSVRSRISDVFKRTTYVDLSSEPTFSDEYMSALFIPHTDASQFPTYMR